MPEPRHLDVPFLNYEAVTDEAERFRRNHPRALETPVDVEAILDLDLRVNIAPHPGLQSLGIDSCVSEDMRTIWVSQYAYDNVEVRYRFSLAHELGHMVLHRRVWATFGFSSAAGWKRLYLSIDPGDYSLLEAQANDFAGLLLVPRAHLEAEFKAALPGVTVMIERARTDEGFARDQYLDYAIGVVADGLRSVFNVSGQTLGIRLRRDGLDKLIE